MISDTSDNSIQCHMKLFSVVLTVMQHAAAMEEAAGKSCCQLMLTIFTATLFIVSLQLCSDTNRLLQPHDVHYTSSESLQVAPLGKKKPQDSNENESRSGGSWTFQRGGNVYKCAMLYGLFHHFQSKSESAISFCGVRENSVIRKKL